MALKAHSNDCSSGPKQRTGCSKDGRERLLTFDVVTSDRDGPSGTVCYNEWAAHSGGGVR